MILFLVKEKDAYKYFDSILGIYSSIDNAIECICNRVRPYISFSHDDNETVVEEKIDGVKDSLIERFIDGNEDYIQQDIYTDDWSFTYTIIKMELDENHF